MIGSGSRGRLMLGALALSGVAVTGCGPKQAAQPMQLSGATAAYRPTPGPGFAVTPDPSQHTPLLQYGASLQFATAVGAIDEQLLIHRTAAGVSVGPWMSLAPELGSAEIPADSLSKGRIIARAFFRSGADSVLAYWYVDSTATGWRSIWITSRPAHPFIVGTLLVHPHTGAGAGRAAKSRVIVDPMSAQTSGCNTCSTTPGWCRDTLLSVSMAPLFGDLAPWVWAGAAPSR